MRAYFTGVIAMLLALTLVGVGGSLWGPAEWTRYFDDLHWTCSFATAGVLASKTYLQAETHSRKVFLRWIAIGLCIEAIGQLIWDVQEYFNFFPFPGPSDIAWIFVGPALCIGAWKHCKLVIDHSSWAYFKLDSLIMLIAMIASSMAVFLPRQGQFTLYELFVMSAYPVGHTAPFCLIMIFLLAERMKFNFKTLLLPVSLLALGICWTQWNLNILGNKLVFGSPLHVSFSVISIVIGVGALLFNPEKNNSLKWDRRCEGILRIIPLAMVLLSALGVILASTMPGVANSVLICVSVGGGAVVILAAFRQYLLLNERDRLLNAESLIRQKEIELTNSNRELEVLNKNLEERIEQRTRQLVQSEKLASLGALVAGVAHELNTPIGNSLLMTSVLTEKFHSLIDSLESGKIRRSELETELHQFEDATGLVQRNLERVAELVKNFKQIAVDRTGESRREFYLNNVINDTLVIKRIFFKKTQFQLQDDIPVDIKMDSYPGAICQLLDILLDNIDRHAFKGKEKGAITVSAHLVATDKVVVEVADDGNGIAEENLLKIFDPFFTTSLGQGGSGLGLHIAWNIVNSILGGNITVKSIQGQGTQFIISIPLNAPERSDFKNQYQS